MAGFLLSSFLHRATDTQSCYPSHAACVFLLAPVWSKTVLCCHWDAVMGHPELQVCRIHCRFQHISTPSDWVGRLLLFLQGQALHHVFGVYLVHALWSEQ